MLVCLKCAGSNQFDHQTLPSQRHPRITVSQRFSLTGSLCWETLWTHYWLLDNLTHGSFPFSVFWDGSLSQKQAVACFQRVTPHKRVWTIDCMCEPDGWKRKTHFRHRPCFLFYQRLKLIVLVTLHLSLCQAIPPERTEITTKQSLMAYCLPICVSIL